MFVKLGKHDRINTDQIREYRINYHEGYKHWQLVIDWIGTADCSAYSCKNEQEAIDALRLLDRVLEPLDANNLFGGSIV